MMAGGAVEVLVVGLQEAIVDAERLPTRWRVRAEHDAVGILQKELARGIRLPAKLGDAGVDVHVHVRILVEGLANRSQVLRVVAEMSADESRLRMAFDD